MAGIVGAIFSALNCVCGTTTCNCIDQYRNFNDDVGDLRRELDTLTNRKQDIESRIEVAEARGGQMVRREVQDWLKQVQDINVDVQAFLEKVQGIKWYKRACLDKLVCRKINVVRKMLEKGSFPEGLVIERAPARGNRIPTENLVGQISTKEEIWGYLMGDEVGMIGVCGIGGVGKTTIMKNLHNDLQRETRFQKVIWVTVSHPLNVFELQKKIAGAMDERLLDDDEVMMRAGALMDIMGSVKFVLILDDVWEKFSLKEVGIPDPKAQNGCKVVVTSRSIELCKKLKYLPSLANLKGLKKLDLHRAGIEVLPQGMEMLISLEYLDLLFCPNLKEIQTGILLNLSSLQYLAICFLREITRVRNFEEVARLKKLETLECNFDDIQDFNSFVNKFKDFQRAIAYSLLVGSAEDMLRRSKHELVITDCEIGEECIVLPNKLEDLWIIRLKNMGSSLSKIALLEKANELRTCNIFRCEKIECVVELDSSSSSSSLRCPVFDKLEELSLNGLPRLCELVRVEGEATPPNVFSNLKKLCVANCWGIRKLLPVELLQALQNLESITIFFCHQMEEIIASLDSEASSSNKFTFTFPKLRELWLWDLPQLKSICNAKGVMVCNSIEAIVMHQCLKLKRIPVQLPQLDNGQPSPPPHLREIWIDKSSKEWWESVEWDHPNAKNLLQPFLKST
ncbi:hypothetical protein SLEP1_g58162 [Rubroshorea leprosula]|uniref:Uncharacterized protein n=1 Tax=Rubroshorea leprosula TaxID=152421 RepID=A0AAV5MSH1_9ROSI|nr:hypothetical protein SLEP1_g58162 [Rubroshorea leprosula]